jgi:hypothetical protein
MPAVFTLKVLRNSQSLHSFRQNRLVFEEVGIREGEGLLRSH